MLKFMGLLFIGVGIYIGVAFSDQFEDIVNTPPVEQVQDMFEGVKEQVSELTSELSKKLDEYRT